MELLVTSFSGASGSLPASVCSALIVEEGGVFSPRMGRGGGLAVGLRAGVSLSGSLVVGAGVGVPGLEK